MLLLLQVDTKDILFVVGGAFIDLERQLMDSRHKSSIGFGNKVRWGCSDLRPQTKTQTHNSHMWCFKNGGP
jgi:ATP-dependent protease Clp ATPase subunit